MIQCSFHAKFLIVKRHCISSVTACKAHRRATQRLRRAQRGVLRPRTSMMDASGL